MDLPYVTFSLFVLFSGVRIVSYLPQIYRVAIDKNGASAIAYSTWFMWIGAHATTGAYAAVNLNDTYLANVSAVFATCCALVILLTYLKRRSIRHHFPVPARTRVVRPFRAKPAVQMADMVLGSVATIFIIGALISMVVEQVSPVDQVAMAMDDPAMNAADGSAAQNA
jgi:hypothetical protein